MKIPGRFLKRALCMVLITVLAAACVPAAGAGEEPDLITGSFVMQPPIDGDPVTDTYYYSDSYFDASGAVYNDHLSTMSAALAFSISGTSDTPDEAFGTLLRDIGFTDIDTWDMDHTAADSMGTVIGSKSLGDTVLIAVVLRGDGYTSEWVSNLTAGAGGDPEGFAASAGLAEQRIAEYLSDHGIASAKYWITGYSRAGGVANLVGRDINADPDAFKTTADDIYVYTFAAPNCSADGTVYDNIYNVADCRDLIPYVYPAGWSIGRSGVPVELGDTQTTVMIVRMIHSQPYYETYKEIGLSSFLEDFAAFCAANISRQTYTEQIEPYVCELIGIYFDHSSAERAEIGEAIKLIADDVAADQNMMTAFFCYTSDMARTWQYGVNEFDRIICSAIDQHADDLPLTEDELASVKSTVKPLLTVLQPVILADYTAKIAVNSSYMYYARLYHLMTLFMNIEEILQYHFNYNIFNSLKARDSYYDKRPGAVLGDADCDGSVTIMDACSVQRYIAEFAVRAFDTGAADANSDGTVTVIDATCIQRWLADLSCPDGIGEPMSP